jgi:hypothetical protein
MNAVERKKYIANCCLILIEEAGYSFDIDQYGRGSRNPMSTDVDSS